MRNRRPTADIYNFPFYAKIIQRFFQLLHILHHGCHAFFIAGIFIFIQQINGRKPISLLLPFFPQRRCRCGNRRRFLYHSFLAVRCRFCCPSRLHRFTLYRCCRSGCRSCLIPRHGRHFPRKFIFRLQLKSRFLWIFRQIVIVSSQYFCFLYCLFLCCLFLNGFLLCLLHAIANLPFLQKLTEILHRISDIIRLFFQRFTGTQAHPRLLLIQRFMNLRQTVQHNSMLLGNHHIFRAGVTGILSLLFPGRCLFVLHKKALQFSQPALLFRRGSLLRRIRSFFFFYDFFFSLLCGFFLTLPVLFLSRT